MGLNCCIEVNTEQGLDADIRGLVETIAFILLELIVCSKSVQNVS